MAKKGVIEEIKKEKSETGSEAEKVEKKTGAKHSVPKAVINLEANEAEGYATLQSIYLSESLLYVRKMRAYKKELESIEESLNVKENDFNKLAMSLRKKYNIPSGRIESVENNKMTIVIGP